jgi:L-asparaginase
MTTGRPRVAIFTLGGTIASDDDGASGGHGVSPRLSAADVLAAVPAAGDVAELEPVSFRLLPSSALTLDDMVELSGAIRNRLDSGCAGAVVVQGTDTLEESAFALDLLNDHDAPIVVTGAMRNPTAAGPDGPANLLAAIRVAGSPAARGLGCLVVFSDEIHAARYARKTHTTSVSTFRSPTTGPLGWTGESEPEITLRPAHRRWLVAQSIATVPAVALITAALGDDGRLLEAVVGGGYRGVVVQALGAGHVPVQMADRLETIAASVPVVLASRTGAGEVLRETYGYPGAERDLLARGLIWSGALDGPKARVLLALALAAGTGRSDLHRVFRAFGSSAEDLPDGPVGVGQMLHSSQP